MFTLFFILTFVCMVIFCAGFLFFIGYGLYYIGYFLAVCLVFAILVGVIEAIAK